MIDFDRKNLEEIISNYKEDEDEENPIKASVGGSLGNHSE